MSVQIATPGVLQEPTHLLLPDSNVNDVLSIAAGTKGTTTVIGIIAVNRGASGRKVTIWRTVDSTDYPIWEGTIGATSAEKEILTAPVQLVAKQTARKIRAQAAAGNEVTVTLITTVSPQA